MAFLGGVVVLAAGVGYDHEVVRAGQPLVGSWDVGAMDWLVALSLLAVACYAAVPLASNRRLTRLYWRRLRRRPLALASAGYLLAFVLLGLVGPAVVGRPEFLGGGSHQPPWLWSVEAGRVSRCLGTVANGRCHGSLAHPFGTTIGNRDVFVYVVNGMQVALQISLVTAAILVPIATFVGTVAAYVGGRVDEVLMRYVDLQQTIPPFFVYLVAQYVLGPSLLLIVTVFGFLNWGSAARLVRSEALAKQRAEYVLAARSAGSPPLRTIRTHLVPNVSSTVVTSVTLQIPALIVIEVTLSFLGIGAPGIWSWGNLVLIGMEYFPTFWWVAVFPLAAILLTVVAFYVLGDALRDVLDPRLGEAT